MSETKYLDKDGLLYVKQKIAAGFVAKETGKGLSTNDYTTEEKNKLSGIETGADVNVIESISVNGTAQTITNKNVDITITATGSVTGVKGNAESEYRDGDVNITPANLGLGNVENKSSATIRGELTSTDVTTALGFTPDANVIETIKVNGVDQTVTSKAVDIIVPTNNNQLTNGAGYQTASDVSSAIDTAIATTYKAQGSVAFASLPAAASTREGFVYNITDAFTTTADFVEGSGHDYPAGTNVVIINTTGTTYKYDVLAGFVDLSGYVQSSDLVAITNAEIDTIFA